MEIVNSRAALLSNYEVYDFLQQYTNAKHENKKANQQQTHFHLANIAYDTVKYLESTPCRYQNKESINNFLTSLKHFKLTKAEKLQLVNLRPTTPVEMQLIIEDSEERFTEEQLEELIQLIQEHLLDESSLTNGA